MSPDVDPAARTAPSSTPPVASGIERRNVTATRCAATTEPGAGKTSTAAGAGSGRPALAAARPERDHDRDRRKRRKRGRLREVALVDADDHEDDERDEREHGDDDPEDGHLLQDDGDDRPLARGDVERLVARVVERDDVALRVDALRDAQAVRPGGRSWTVHVGAIERATSVSPLPCVLQELGRGRGKRRGGPASRSAGFS